MSESPPVRDDSDESEGSLVNVANEPSPKNVVSNKKQSFIDKFLVDYVKFTSSAINTDRSLKLMQWTIWLASYIKKSKGLQKLSTDLSFARYALRLLGLPASIEAARTGSWGDSSGSSSNPWIHKLGRLMAWSMIGYYPLEHVAYLRWTSPQLLPGRNAEKMSAYSCRFWLVYIVADMTKSILKCKELLRRRSELAADDDTEEEVSFSLFLSLRGDAKCDIDARVLTIILFIHCVT